MQAQSPGDQHAELPSELPPLVRSGDAKGKKSVKADILTPKQLFQRDIRYMIPLFQRPYVWNQEDQWEPLWEDVRATSERFLEALAKFGPERMAEAERAVAPHFLGAVVLQQQATSTLEIEQRYVIDGQQRLTTLQILLDAAQEVCEGMGLMGEAKRLSKLVLNDEDLTGSNPDQGFKVWPTMGDQDPFRAAMTNGQGTEEFADSAIVQAHDYFQLQIEEWLRSGAEETSLLSRALETTLAGLLNLVVIDLEGSDDAHVIFETLNARGTPLIDSDLIKNYFLYHVQQDGGSQKEQYERVWKPLDDRWWRAEVRQGRLVRPKLDVYLNYWLTMRTRSEVTASRVFDAFRDYAKDRAIGDVGRDMSEVATTYRSLENRQDAEEARFMSRIRVLDAGVITPVLLLLFSTSDQVLAPARRIRALKAIESYLVRRMVCRLTSKNYNRHMLDLVEVLDGGNLPSADQVTLDFLAKGDSDAVLWPTDADVTAAFESLPLYRLLTRGRLRLVLEGIERAMRTSKSEHLEVPPNLTIEHVMPQSWLAHWGPPPEHEDGPERAIEQRNRIVHTVGNLTLVNKRLNPSLSNGPWEKKRRALAEHSVLFLNKNLLATEEGAGWGEDAIRQRARRLAGYAVQEWPRP